MAQTFNPDDVLVLEAKNGTVPTAQGSLIMKEIVQGSKIMQLGNFEEMVDANGLPVKEKEFSYLAEIPGAYWVGETEPIKTDKPTWLKAKMTAKKLAVIIVVSNEYLNYKLPDFFEKVKPQLVEAFHKKFDEAGILNVNNPFPQSIDGSAVNTSNVVEGEITYDNLLALEDTLLENDVEANGFVSKKQNNTALREAIRVENGTTQRLYDRNGDTTTIDGSVVVDLKSTNMKKGTLYAGDFSHLYYGIPVDMTYLIDTSTTLTTIKNADGSNINLFEQDLIALRATMDVAFMITKEGAFAKLEAAPSV